MGNLVIVAIPEPDDPVWFFSSEKVPHMTLLFLGDAEKVQNQGKIVEFLEHAASVSLCKLWLDVDHRGILGPDEADVLFFTKSGWDDGAKVTQFRDYLLQDDNIKKAYLDAAQFPEWQPHLTLGYPTKPAKPPKDPMHDRFWSVRFDRIALWTGDFEGPEFNLKAYPNAEVGMSAVDDILSHHGIKGMKWGVRKADRSTPQEVKVHRRGGAGKERVVVTGGKRRTAHPESIAARVSTQVGKKSGLQALSNDELRVLATRLQLEKQVSTLAKDRLTSNGKKAVEAAMEAQKLGLV